METDIKNRVKVALRALDISPYSIARMQNLNERTIYDQINGNSKIGVATIEALLSYRPDLSAEWLLRGTGDMLITTSPRKSISTTPTWGTITPTLVRVHKR